MLTDAELLRRYADQKSDAAFGELVARRIDLVHSVAFRQCGGDAHLTQDVVQRVFQDLARKAAILSERAVLTGWLYRSAQFAASDLVRAERRRRARELEAHSMQALHDEPVRDADWERFRPTLDEAIGELGETDRDAVMLRFFEKRPFREIGTALQLSEDAARMRVDRALDKLRVRLANRGVVSTAAALAMGLANQAGIAAPTGLVSAVTGAALAVSGTGGVVAASVGMKLIATTAVVLALVGIGTAVFSSRVPSQGGNPPATVAAKPVASTAPVPNSTASLGRSPASPPVTAIGSAPASPPPPNTAVFPTVPVPAATPATVPAVAVTRPPQVFTPGGTTTELEARMDEINAAFRRLGRQVDHPSRNADSLRLVAVIRENAQAALELEPKKKLALPAGAQEKFIEDYRAAMKEFLRHVQALEAKLKAGDNAAANAVLTTMKQAQEAGHRDFKVDRKGRR